MALPKVNISFGNGNLLQDITGVDLAPGIVGTVATVGLQGVCKSVQNLDDAATQGYTESAEPDMYRHIKEYYAEVAGNKTLWVMGVPDTMTMAQMLTNTNADGAKKLCIAAGGAIRLLAVFRKPPAGYNAGADYMDADVAAAVTASKVFAAARLAELVPLRILVEGRVADDTDAVIYSPNTATNGYAGVVLGGSLSNGSASVGAALGRASAYGAHIKLGKVANGPLSLTAAYIGSKAIKDVTNLEVLHDKGYITFMIHPQKAGFYFGKDFMASADDYRFLTNGLIVDKAAVIAAAVYINELQGEVEVDAAGKISELDINHLKGRIEQQIQVGMPGQISALDVYISPNQNIVNTGTLNIKLSITPLGYTSTINVEIGLKSGS